MMTWRGSAGFGLRMIVRLRVLRHTLQPHSAPKNATTTPATTVARLYLAGRGLTNTTPHGSELCCILSLTARSGFNK